MKKTFLISILTILLIAFFVLPINQEQVITKSQITPTFSIPLATNKISINTYVPIINVNNRWIDENTIRMNINPLLDFHDEYGNYKYCPSGNMVCQSMGLECVGLEYKYENQDWILINRSIDDQTPCEFENVTIQQSATYSSLYLPYGVFFWGINRYWDDFGLNTIRGASYYNFTIMQITPTNATIKVNLRFEKDRAPQILTIPVGQMRIYDKKEDAMVFLRRTNVSAKIVDLTIVQEADSTFRAICREPGFNPRITPTKTLIK
jgi:hypothetical protein